eukprot:746069-Hanusia_phi.AAC.5
MSEVERSAQMIRMACLDSMSATSLKDAMKRWDNAYKKRVDISILPPNPLTLSLSSPSSSLTPTSSYSFFILLILLLSPPPRPSSSRSLMVSDVQFASKDQSARVCQGEHRNAQPGNDESSQGKGEGEEEIKLLKEKVARQEAEIYEIKGRSQTKISALTVRSIRQAACAVPVSSPCPPGHTERSAATALLQLRGNLSHAGTRRREGLDHSEVAGEPSIPTSSPSPQTCSRRSCRKGESRRTPVDPSAP